MTTIGRSATETLIAALESLSEAEENQILVLIRNSNGEVIYNSNLSYRSDRIGIRQSQLMHEQAQMVAEELRA